MTEDTIGSTYRAIARIEDHCASKLELISVYRQAARNTPRGSEDRRFFEGRLRTHIEELGALHAERDRLRKRVMQLRGKTE